MELLWIFALRKAVQQCQEDQGKMLQYSSFKTYQYLCFCNLLKICLNYLFIFKHKFTYIQQKKKKKTLLITVSRRMYGNYSYINVSYTFIYIFKCLYLKLVNEWLWHIYLMIFVWFVFRHIKSLWASIQWQQCSPARTCCLLF